MSQIYKRTTAGSLPPSVPTQFNTQNGNATPLANILIINGFDDTTNNNNGVETRGGVSGTGTQNEVDVVITNRFQVLASTVGVGPTIALGMTLSSTPGTYNFEIKISGYNSSTPASTAFTILACVRSNGTTATLVGIPDETFIEDFSLSSCDVDVSVGANNIGLSFRGVAGLNINWNAVGTYVFVS